MPVPYATSEHLALWLGDAPPATADALLARASRVIDRLTRLLRYDVDDAGVPVDERVRVALRDATCAQAQAWIDSGQADQLDPKIMAGQVGSVTLGKVTLTTGRAARAAATAGRSWDWTSPAPGARDVLTSAGLWPPRVRTI